jgi:hypothetical protein
VRGGEAHAAVLPSTTRSAGPSVSASASPARKSSKEGPAASFWLKGAGLALALELGPEPEGTDDDGVAKFRANARVAEDVLAQRRRADMMSEDEEAERGRRRRTSKGQKAGRTGVPERRRNTQ